jgi:hypothetical protein
MPGTDVVSVSKSRSRTADRLGIVLVAYDNGDSIEQLLAVLSEEKRPGDRIVLVDNHPPHACARLAESVGAVDEIIRSENVGFGAGCNRGAARIENEVDLLLFLNPDSLPERGAITLLRKGGREEWAAWMGLLLLPSGRINSAGNTVHTSGLAWCTGYGEDPTDFHSDRDVVALSGADMVVRSRVWRRLGGFAEGYFLYYEDIDLCFRLRQMGYELGVVWDAHIAHDYEFQKGAQKWFLLERNRYVFIARTWPLGLLLALSPLLVASETGLWLASFFQRRLLIRLRAVSSFARVLPRVLGERRSISRERVLTAYECLRMLEPRIDTPLLPRFSRNRVTSAVFAVYQKGAGLILRVTGFARRGRSHTARQC